MSAPAQLDSGIDLLAFLGLDLNVLGSYHSKLVLRRLIVSRLRQNQVDSNCPSVIPAMLNGSVCYATGPNMKGGKEPPRLLAQL
jgi:hypothetical protein